MIRTGLLHCRVQVEQERLAICDLMTTYVNVPMSFADACLVRLSELEPNVPVITIDSDFGVYRRLRKLPVSRVTPNGDFDL